MTEEKTMRKKNLFLVVVIFISSILLVSGCSEIRGFSNRSSEPAFDVLIKGGIILDGTLAKPQVTDIGIKDDKIAAIRSMTSLPAEKFRMKGRGKIEEGYFADIAIINLDTITDHATYDNPEQYSEGINYLFVNGVMAIENGKATGKRGGKVLKRR